MEHFPHDGDYPNYYDSSFIPSDMRPGHPAPGNTVSVTPNARMKTYGVATVPQQTRHARRIYVGGIPPNYLDEDTIRAFVNSMIAQGLKEENDHSYVLSVYINQKKCFAFVELKSIELATACLELDGILLKNSALRILRANEYKPELIPQSLNKVIRFDLSSFQFGAVTATAITGPSGWKQGVEMEDTFVERTLDSLIQFANLSNLEAGSVTVVGYPFDDSLNSNNNTPALPSRHGSHSLRGSGCTLSPKHFRATLKKYKGGSLDNPEYEVDLSRLKVVDVGDVLPGKSSEETKLNLTTTVSELLARGSVPFVIGGSMELAYHSTLGLLGTSNSKVGAVYVSAHADIKLLDDARFYGMRSPQTASAISCQGRFVAFAAQGSEYSRDEANYIRDRGGRIVWASRDLHQSSSRSHSPVDYFQEILREASLEGPISLTIDAGVLTASSSPHANTSNTAQGLSIEDLLAMMRVAGSDPNVVLVNVTEFSPESEESRVNLLLTDLFYHFLIGLATRREETERKNSLPSPASQLLPSQPGPSLQQKERRPSYPDPSAGGGGGGGGQQRSIFHSSSATESQSMGRPPMSHNAFASGGNPNDPSYDHYYSQNNLMNIRQSLGRSLSNADPLMLARPNPPPSIPPVMPAAPYFANQPVAMTANKSFGMTIDSPKSQLAVETSRAFPRSLSTISSLSSTPAIQSFYRTASSTSSYHPTSSNPNNNSSSNQKLMSGHSFNYSSSAGASPGYHPLGISSAFSQSIPDIINELHPFDETLDLDHEERHRRKSFQELTAAATPSGPPAPLTMTDPVPVVSSHHYNQNPSQMISSSNKTSTNNSGSNTPTAIGGGVTKTIPPLPPQQSTTPASAQLAVSTFSSDTIVYPTSLNINTAALDISQQSPSTVVTRSFQFEEIPPAAANAATGTASTSETHKEV